MKLPLPTLLLRPDPWGRFVKVFMMVSIMAGLPADLISGPVSSPDLSRVDEIGFTDLMRGGRTDASSRLDWIKVYGNAVPR